MSDNIWQKYLKGELPEIDLGMIEKEELEESDKEIILDLHDHTEEQAYNAIIKIIEEAVKLSCYKIKIITGKGSSYPKEPGRLFTIVPQWLDALKQNGLIKSYSRKQEGIVLVKLEQ